MLRPAALLTVFSLMSPLFAQQPAETPQQPQPQVRVNVINVCSPSEEEQKQIAAALKLVPLKPGFSPDFEVSRGRSTMPDTPVANWVRVRREFRADAPFTSVQYSMSVDENSIVETLVFKARDPKDILQLTIDDRVSAPATPALVTSTDTPARRVKLERFGQSSLGLSRCPETDQAAYEGLFQSASTIFARYRDALDVRRTVPADMARLGVSSRKKSPAADKPAPQAQAEKPRQ